jgi:hypothetical protein
MTNVILTNPPFCSATAIQCDEFVLAPAGVDVWVRTGNSYRAATINDPNTSGIATFTATTCVVCPTTTTSTSSTSTTEPPPSPSSSSSSSISSPSLPADSSSGGSSLENHLCWEIATSALKPFKDALMTALHEEIQRGGAGVFF